MKHSVIMGGILIGLGIHCGSAFAAGLEKTVPWSGRYAGVAGAAASSVSGSESLYFNPAGMADSTHLDTSLNFSPVFPQFTSPLPVPNTSVNSSRAFVPEFGVFVKYSPLEHLAFGVGAYASGGSKAIYQNVDFTGLSPALAAFKPTIEADLNLIEYSLGAAYEILDGLRVGASWRVLQAFGTVGTVSNVPTTVFTDLLFNNLTDVQWNGFRFGVQYFPKDSRWGLGAFYRTQVTFTASGTTGGTVFVPATQTSTPIPSSGTSLSAVFPHQFGVGGHFDAIPKTWRLALQYEFDQYQVDQQIVTTGSVGASPIP
ncbi:MAG: OmpP1/FadL family transporter, partial [Bdellovibrionota bacterium]